MSTGRPAEILPCRVTQRTFASLTDGEWCVFYFSEKGEEMTEPRRTRTFVDPGPSPVKMVRLEPEPWPEDMPQLPMVAQTRHVISGSPVQQSAAFTLAYSPFALSAAALAGLVAAVSGAALPGVVIVILVVLSVTWLAGFIVSQMVSAAGVDLVKIVLGYRLIRHEQRHRHTRQRMQ